MRLCPSQGFCIRIDAYFGDVEVYASSKFFDQTKQITDADGNRYYHFEQKFDLNFWSKISHLHLGEVIIFSDKLTCSVCVVLECANPSKTFVVTAINPLGAELKIDAHQILEVVLYDDLLHPEDDWKCEINTGTDGLTYECLGRVALSKEDMRYTKWATRSPDEVYYHCPRFMERISSYRQQHFWFRCSGPTINQLFNKGVGIHNAGNLVFSSSTTTARYQVSVRLRIKEKDKNRIYQPLLLPRLESSSRPIYTALGPHLPLYRQLVLSRKPDRDEGKFARKVTLRRKPTSGFCY